MKWLKQYEGKKQQNIEVQISNESLQSTLPRTLMANLFSSGAPHIHFFSVLQPFYLSGLPTVMFRSKASSKSIY